MQNFITKLQAHPYYKVYMMDQKPIIIFEDHRFTVPVLWLAEKHGLIQSNMNMIRFDGHLDMLDFDQNSVEEFRKLKNFPDAFRFCETKLRKEDDDWLAFALHEKLINHVLTFCQRKDEPPAQYKDRSFKLNRFDGVAEEPLSQNFVGKTAALLDIDCDYFTFPWREGTFAWTDEFYQREFSKPTNRKVLNQIVEAAPFITICRETYFCGGAENVADILKHLDQYILNNALSENNQ